MRNDHFNQVNKPHTIDYREINRFSATADQWWDPDGAFKPLHALNPLRLQFIRDHVTDHFALTKNTTNKRLPYTGIAMLDIGCGGGILSEPLARLGADVTGIDVDPVGIEVARLHALDHALTIDYRQAAPEDMLGVKKQFDVVFALEIVEHVSDIQAFIAICAKLVKPGGLLFASTINRTWMSWCLAILAAEYVLRWLPQGTHQWHKFVEPRVFVNELAEAGLRQRAITGVLFNPLTMEFSYSDNKDVNYMLVAEKKP